MLASLMNKYLMSIYSVPGCGDTAVDKPDTAVDKPDEDKQSNIINK